MGCASSKEVDPWVLAAKGLAQQLHHWLERGGNPSALDRHAGRGTLLHAAAQCDQAECIKVLLCAGARVNAVTKLRGSPLHVAAAQRAGRSLKLLLDSGADPLLKNAEGKTAIDVAEAAGHKANASLLRAAAIKLQGGGSSGSSGSDASGSGVPKSELDTILAWAAESAAAPAATPAGAPATAAAPAASPAAPAQKTQPAHTRAAAAAAARKPAAAAQPATPAAAAATAATAGPRKSAETPQCRQASGAPPKATAASIGGAFGYPEWDARLASVVRAEEGHTPRRLIGLPSELASLLATAPQVQTAQEQQPQPQQQPQHWPGSGGSSGGGSAIHGAHLLRQHGVDHHHPAPVPEDTALPDGLAYSVDVASYLEDLGFHDAELNTTMALCGDEETATLAGFKSMLGSPYLPSPAKAGLDRGPPGSPRQQLLLQQQQQQQQQQQGRQQQQQVRQQQQQQQQQGRQQQQRGRQGSTSPLSTAAAVAAPQPAPAHAPPVAAAPRSSHHQGSHAPVSVAAVAAAAPQLQRHTPTRVATSAAAAPHAPPPAPAPAPAVAPLHGGKYSDDFLERVRAATAARRNSEHGGSMGGSRPQLPHIQRGQSTTSSLGPASVASEPLRGSGRAGSLGSAGPATPAAAWTAGPAGRHVDRPAVRDQ